MKCSIPEISWHNREPVLSVDIFGSEGGECYRLATGGSDTLILIWQLKIIETGAVDIDILSELTRHQKAVNVVRWSPNGDFLASGDDDANIIIWQLKTDNIPLLEGDNNNKETWMVHKVLRCHKEDVYDICWAPNGAKLLSGSVDNTAILWDLTKGKSENILTDHKGFVQGVAWDPKNDFIATLSSDRICRLFHTSGKLVRARISRGFLPVEESHNLHNKEVKYFHDDTFKTFFRRLNFSPDGNLLLVPSGCVETEHDKSAMYATYIFTLDSLKQPAIILPTAKQCSIVVKCSPVLYELRPNGPKPYIDLPYRMIIAVATESDVILYDTQQLSPFAHMQKIHYTRLTDLAWSHDSLLLAASSTDGYITLVTFENQELGVVYKKEESENEEVVEEPVVEEKVEVKQKRSSFIEQWAKQGPKRKANDEPVIGAKKIKNDEATVIPDSPVKSEVIKTPRKRVTPITLKAVTPKKVKRKESGDKERNHADTKEEMESDDDNKDKKDNAKASNEETSEDKKVHPQNSEQPKTPKRAQLITLRLGPSKNEVSKSDCIRITDKSNEGITEKTIEIEEGGSSDIVTVNENLNNETDNKKEGAYDEPKEITKNQAKQVMKDETNKPKRRVQLIKVGECSKTKKSSAPKETETGLESSLISKLKFALNKPALEKDENSGDPEKPEKQNLAPMDIDDRKNPDETDKGKLLDAAEATEKGSKNVEKGSEEAKKTSSDNVMKTNDDEKATSEETPNDAEISTINDVEETMNKEEKNIENADGDKTSNKTVKETEPELIDLDSCKKTIKSPPRGKMTIVPKCKKTSNNEEKNITKTANDENETKESEIIDVDNYKPSIKSTFPSKKIETPKRTPGSSKRAPKADSKISPGRIKKKQSVTPKVSLLDFFKPISSETKSKTEPSDDKEAAKMKPTALFKHKESDDNLVVVEDSDSGNDVEVLKVKTSGLLKKKRKAGKSPKKLIEDSEKIEASDGKKTEMVVKTEESASTSKEEKSDSCTMMEVSNTSKASAIVNTPKKVEKSAAGSIDKEKATGDSENIMAAEKIVGARSGFKNAEERIDSSTKKTQDKEDSGGHKKSNIFSVPKTEKSSDSTRITPKRSPPVIEPRTIELLQEDTVPDDFTLQIEESMDAELKENKVEEVKPEKVKQPRRIPLITLASPKGKKKRVDT